MVPDEILGVLGPTKYDLGKRGGGGWWGGGGHEKNMRRMRATIL